VNGNAEPHSAQVISTSGMFVSLRKAVCEEGLGTPLTSKGLALVFELPRS
jgi:hypothetical protein